tara:strand:- start:424 stop:1029 length:606 start_codon:yes stop_codon:yes gene_type:complete
MNRDFLRFGNASADARLILLHGWGADAEDLMPLGEELISLINKDVELVSLRAPEAHPEGIGRQWYGLFPAKWSSVPSAIRILQSRIKSFSSESIGLEKTILLGFSQGGAMAISAGCDMPLRGIISCSGYIHPGWKPPKERPPIFLTHGTEDQVVPVAAARQILNNFDGNKSYLDGYFFKGGHEIPLDAIRKISYILSSWLT